MVTNAEAAPRIVAGGSAACEKSSRLTWLAVAVVFVAAMLLRQVVPPNTDVSWLLTVGERVLDGQRLYRDIVEINPPMAVLAYLPGIALARVLGLDPEYVIDAQILLLAAVSLLATARILRLSPATQHPAAGLLAIWAAAVVTILPMQVFGQREHIATLTLLPALAVYALRGERESLPLWALLLAGFGTAVTLAFKPFFAVPVVLCAALAARRARSWQVLFAPENLIAGGIVCAFSLCTYLAYPEYFTITYPIVRDTYLSWSMPASVIFFNPATLLFVVATLLVATARRAGTLNAAAATAWTASAGFAVSFYLQRRGWSYHSYPMVALAMLAMGYATVAAAAFRSNSLRPNAVAWLVLAGTFIVGSQWFYANINVGPIGAAVARLKPNPRILMLSGEAAIGHPLVRAVHGVWVSRQENLWIREFVRLTREHNAVDPAAAARLSAYLALERNWLIEDFQEAAARRGPGRQPARRLGGLGGRRCGAVTTAQALSPRANRGWGRCLATERLTG